MSDSLMVVISIFVAVILMFIFPLMSISDRNDDIAQTIVQTEVSEFVDKISVAGKIRPSDYEAFVAKVNAANGAPYDIEIQVQQSCRMPSWESSVAAMSLWFMRMSILRGAFTAPPSQSIGAWKKPGSL